MNDRGFEGAEDSETVGILIQLLWGMKDETLKDDIYTATLGWVQRCAMTNADRPYTAEELVKIRQIWENPLAMILYGGAAKQVMEEYRAKNDQGQGDFS